VWFGTRANSATIGDLPRRQFLPLCLLVASALVGTLGLVGAAGEAAAQAIEERHWQGLAAATRQPEHVVAGTMAEWRSLWNRVGKEPPVGFEPGRMNAVGIFLGRRASEGYSINILSTSRRRDRIVVVFEERMPAEIMLAQRASPTTTTRPVSSSPNFGPSGIGGGGFGGPGAGFLQPGTVSSLPPPSPRPATQPTSPWAIVLIHRADLPVSVEQRLFR
jgi:hypothetical protein